MKYLKNHGQRHPYLVLDYSCSCLYCNLVEIQDNSKSKRGGHFYLEATRIGTVEHRICVLENEEQKNEEISDLKKQVLDLENFLTCLIMIIYMMNEADRQSFQSHMENRSLMEELVEMKMEYDQAKK